jgi:hypothetical protein
MLGTLKAEKLIKTIQENDPKAQIVFMGDKKQFVAIEQGNTFGLIQDHAKSVEMTEVLRQKTTATKKIVAKFKQGDYKGVVDSLEKSNNLKEDDNLRDLKTELAKDATAAILAHGSDKVAVIAGQNASVNELNSLIRDNLKASGQLKNGVVFETLSDKRLNNVDSRVVANYEIGNILIQKTQNEQSKKENVDKFSVVRIDKENNSIEVKGQNKNGDVVEKTLKGADLSKFTAYKTEEKEFAVGDKTLFLKNQKQFKNGETGKITKIKDGVISVEMGKKTIKLDTAKGEHLHMNHGFAITTMKSQGGSIGHIFGLAISSEANKNGGYVQNTRMEQNLKLYTDDKAKLIEKWKSEQKKENLDDYEKIKGEKMQVKSLEHNEKQTTKASTTEQIKPLNSQAEALSKINSSDKLQDTRQVQALDRLKNSDTKMEQSQNKTQDQGQIKGQSANQAHGKTTTTQERTNELERTRER